MATVQRDHSGGVPEGVQGTDSLIGRQQAPDTSFLAHKHTLLNVNMLTVLVTKPWRVKQTDVR